MGDLGEHESASRDSVSRPVIVRRVLLLVGVAALGLLFLVGLINLVAPRTLGRLLAGPATPVPSPTPRQPRAAIIDQTGMSFPSPDFITQAEAILEQGGYAVTHHPPEEITVNFYRTLPADGYNFILFQSHATSQVVARDGGQSDRPPGPFLFTTEEYEAQSYVSLQLTDQVRASQLFYEDSPELFAVGPKFVRRTMQGFFPGTIIIIGGCQSLAAPDLAQSFLDKGASVVIGWDGMVNLSHNNEAVLVLLQEMVVNNASPEQAVETAMAEVGPDPQFESALNLMRQN